MSLSSLLKPVNENISTKKQSIKDLVYKAVLHIEDVSLLSIRPRPKTITSFIKGSENSPFYTRFFIKHEDICGAMKNVTLDDVTKAIDDLILEGRLVLKDSDLSINKSIHQVQHEIDSIFENRKKADVFDEKELMLLSDWEGTHKGSTKTKMVKTNDGYLFHCDSKEEESIIKKLTKKNYYKILRGQTFSIDYMRNGKKPKLYFVDIVMLTHDNRVALMEVKQLRMMSYFENILKYEALKNFCEQKGYIYTMCDRTFKTFESLKKMKVNPKIKSEFNKMLYKNGYFDKEHYKVLTQGMNTKQKLRVQLELTALTIQLNLRNKDKYNFDIKFKDFLLIDHK